ncbi:hypothetical protein ACFPRL_01680 [Pseudoclavibacter helvolus]
MALRRGNPDPSTLGRVIGDRRRLMLTFRLVATRSPTAAARRMFPSGLSSGSP